MFRLPGRSGSACRASHTRRPPGHVDEEGEPPAEGKASTNAPPTNGPRAVNTPDSPDQAPIAWPAVVAAEHRVEQCQGRGNQSAAAAPLQHAGGDEQGQVRRQSAQHAGHRETDLSRSGRCAVFRPDLPAHHPPERASPTSTNSRRVPTAYPRAAAEVLHDPGAATVTMVLSRRPCRRRRCWRPDLAPRGR